MLHVGVKIAPEQSFDWSFGTARSSDECFGDISQICFVYEMGSFRQFHRHPEFQYGGLKPEIILFETNSRDESAYLCSYGS
jgi:hypothetical protein